MSYRMCVKSIVDKSAFEAITDECPHLINFCTIIEHILSHRLQGNIIWLYMHLDYNTYVKVVVDKV